MTHKNKIILVIITFLSILAVSYLLTSCTTARQPSCDYVRKHYNGYK